MKISLDLHGVIDKEPRKFKKYVDEVVENGDEVYILTGSSYIDAISELAELRFNIKNIKEIISVTDYLIDKKTPWEYDKYKRPSFHPSIWWGTKGRIARERGFDLHIDDSRDFETFFTTPFMLYEV